VELRMEGRPLAGSSLRESGVRAGTQITLARLKVDESNP
jgi:hypothetical protein